MVTAEKAATKQTRGRVVDAVWLRELVACALDAGDRVLGPTERDGVLLYEEIRDPRHLVLAEVLPMRSPKEQFLTPSGNGATATPREDTAEPRQTLLVGCRPCEARALAVLDTYFRWSGTDEEYLARRARTTTISFTCRNPRPYCFCASVGGGPASPVGSDALVSILADGRMMLTSHTVKGNALLGSSYGVLPRQMPVSPHLRRKFDVELACDWLRAHASGNEWTELSAACTGCGACRFQCPTCSCIDSENVVNWCCAGDCQDTGCCALSLFSLRTPEAGTSRWQQWLLHKFVHFPRAHGCLGCVGCGRCIRACGAGVNLTDVMRSTERRARAERSAAEQ